MSNEQYKRSARLAEPLRQELLDRMDRYANSEESVRVDQRTNQRKDPRWPYRLNDIEVTVEHPAGGVSRLLLASRNLSAGGIAFLHGGFLYTRSRCKLTLMRLDGQAQMISGTVVNCRHIQGLLHEIGLKFDRRIDPHQFVRSAVTNSSDTQDKVELSDLHGRVLLADANDVDRALMAHHLKNSGIKLMPVGTAGAALDTVKQKVVDVVLCDLNFDNVDGVELIKRIRDAKFKGPIVAVTAETNQGRIAQAREAGAGYVLNKPYEPEDLHNLLIKLHRKIGAVVSRTALYSNMDDQPGMALLIVQYIEQAQRTARRIEKAMTEGTFAEVRQLCLNLKGSAVGYGFAQLGGAAAEVLQALDSSESVQQSAAQLRTLCMLCDRLRVRSKRPEGPAAARGSSEMV